MFSAYNSLLESRPLATKAVTSGAIGETAVSAACELTAISSFGDSSQSATNFLPGAMSLRCMYAVAAKYFRTVNPSFPVPLPWPFE